MSATASSQAIAEGSIYAYNPVDTGDLSASDLDAALKEAGTGITFSADDFANGTNYITKTFDGITASASYDPITHTINAYGTDDRGDTFIAQASGDIAAAVHFGMTTEGQMLARAVGGGGQDSRAFTLGHAADGATVQEEGHGHADSNPAGEKAPLNTLTTLTGVVGDKRALGTATISAQSVSTPASSAAAPASGASTTATPSTGSSLPSE